MEMVEERSFQLKLNRKIIIYLPVIICCIFVGYTFYKDTNTEIVSFESIGGISREVIRYRNVYYYVETDVIHHKSDYENPYTFFITPVYTAVLREGPVAVQGKVEDFNRVASEIIFSSSDKVRSDSAYLSQFVKGGAQSIIDMLTGIFQMISSPIETAKAIFKLGYTIITTIKDLWTGQTNWEDIKSSIKEFAEMYWYDLCSRTADSHGLNYDNIVYSETRNVIEGYSKAVLGGAVLVEVATAYISFAKIDKASKLSKAGRSATGIANTFKFVKSASVRKPIVKFSTFGNKQYKFQLWRTKIVNSTVSFVRKPSLTDWNTDISFIYNPLKMKWSTEYFSSTLGKTKIYANHLYKNSFYPMKGFFRSFKKFKAYDTNGNILGEYSLDRFYNKNKIIKMPYEGIEGSTSRGFKRDKNYYWNNYSESFNKDLSDENMKRIANNLSPVVDSKWVENYPNHKAFIGETLEHHHLDHGGNAIPLPKTLHTGKLNTDLWHYE